MSPFFPMGICDSLRLSLFAAFVALCFFASSSASALGLARNAVLCVVPGSNPPRDSARVRRVRYLGTGYARRGSSWGRSSQFTGPNGAVTAGSRFTGSPSPRPRARRGDDGGDALAHSRSWYELTGGCELLKSTRT